MVQRITPVAAKAARVAEAAAKAVKRLGRALLSRRGTVCMALPVRTFMLSSSLRAFSSSILPAFALSSRRLASVTNPLAPKGMFPALRLTTPRRTSPRRTSPPVVGAVLMVVVVGAGPGLVRHPGPSVRQGLTARVSPTSRAVYIIRPRPAVLVLPGRLLRLPSPGLLSL